MIVINLIKVNDLGLSSKAENEILGLNLLVIRRRLLERMKIFWKVSQKMVWSFLEKQKLFVNLKVS